CGYYKDQLLIVRNLAENLGGEEAAVPEKAGLSAQTRERLKKLIASGMN
ncbi:MAG: hypothetical protein GWM98_02210, partial [Nitrospinaceae bacterium]|nr:hypothetical protein [Nitrospinaceae bacterium]NIR53526.1 hypothetical protein [Nitrospinaceae bacterium]NIS83925.1 hypothetical protein [Nitrospinaceae bacterium]NIT80733.1 hypothetical protein [Nitrospinaceae bacterium]NIU43042.1 hypothetical protein [Nitrospinaceae bacterium]